jgi:hypothetical protein
VDREQDHVLEPEAADDPQKDESSKVDRTDGHRVADPLGEGRERASRVRRRMSLAWEPHHREADENRQIRHGVQPAMPFTDHRDAIGDRGPDDPGGIEGGRVERDRV